MQTMTRKFICTSNSCWYTPSFCRWANLDKNRWIDGETPIEDCGMYLILDEEIDSKSADRIFLALLGHAEGQSPEIKNEITRDDELFRSMYSPQLLTEKENRIFLELIK